MTEQESLEIEAAMAARRREYALKRAWTPIKQLDIEAMASAAELDMSDRHRKRSGGSEPESWWADVLLPAAIGVAITMMFFFLPDIGRWLVAHWR